MPAPTQPVTINIADFGGPSVAGITVTARLDQVDYTADGTFVGTEPVTGVTDVNGQVVLHLFPNALPPTGLGTVGSVVRVSAPIPSSQALDVLAMVPNAPSNLVNIIAVETPTGLSAIQQAVRAAIDSRLYPNTYAIAPTTRPDGSPRQAGDRYLDTGYSEWRWTGAAWVNIEANAAASAATATAQAVLATTAKTGAQTAQTGAETALASAQLLVASFRYSTKALMDADLAHAAGTFAIVYADATSANNQIYYKLGASGAGSWQPYQGDRVTVLESQTVNYRAAGDPIGVGLLNTFLAWAWTLNDPLGRIAGGLTADSVLRFIGMEAQEEFTLRGITHKAPTLTGGYARTIEDPAGNVVEGLRWSGERVIALPKEALPTHVHPQGGGRFHAEINLIINAGQSLAVGASGAIINSQEYDNTKIGLATDTVFSPGFNPGGEPPSAGMLSHAKQLLVNENGIQFTDLFYRLCYMDTGVSANNIAQLSPGGSSGAYENGVAGMHTAHALATSLGRTFAINAVTWTQGEADNGISEATYKSAEMALAESYNTAAKAETGQAHDIAFISYQTCSDVSPTVPVAQWKAAMEHRLIYMACPIYFMPYADFQHLNSVGENWLGGYYGLVYKRVVIERKDWEPLQPTRVAIVGNNIDLYFNRKDLALDTTLMPAQTNSGFSVENSGGAAQTINSVTLLEGGRVRLALATTPATDWHVKYGHNSVTGKAPFVGGGGNLRDTQGSTIVYRGNPMHNWCVIFDWKV